VAVTDLRHGGRGLREGKGTEMGQTQAHLTTSATPCLAGDRWKGIAGDRCLAGDRWKGNAMLGRRDRGDCGRDAMLGKGIVGAGAAAGTPCLGRGSRGLRQGRGRCVGCGLDNAAERAPTGEVDAYVRIIIVVEILMNSDHIYKTHISSIA
jgi:hypothetical protein